MAEIKGGSASVVDSTIIGGIGAIQAIKGEKGDTGNGIESIVLNSDYTLTINFTDGTSITTISIRGEKGDKGEDGAKGEQGEKGDKGDKGEDGAEGKSGVYIGDTEPTDDSNVWIDTSGTYDISDGSEVAY